MTLSKLTTDLNIVSTLADLPNATSGLTAAQLKAKFDEGPNDIKTYINNTLTSEIDTQLAAGGTALTTHKTSGDHDTRYYTQAQADAKYETITDLTTNRKLSATGDFTGTLNGYTIVAADPGLSSAFTALKADVVQRGVNICSAPYNAIGDGHLIDSTLVISSVTYNVKKYVGTSNITALTNALTSNKNIYIPDGVYVIDGNITLTGDHTITGQSKSGTVIVLTNSATLINGCTNLKVSNCSIVGEYDTFDVPIQINAGNYTTNDTFGYKSNGFTLYTNDGVDKNSFVLENVKFIMLKNAFDTVHDTVTLSNNKYLDLFRATNCETKNIWWHGFGLRYVKIAMIQGNYFYKHWVGMMVDFSTQVLKGSMSSCTGERVTCMFKTQTYVGADCSNVMISNNTYISCDAADKNYKQYCYKLMGTGHTVQNNNIIINDSYTNCMFVYASDSVIQGNKITVNGTITYLFKPAADGSINPNIIVRNNSVKGVTFQSFLEFDSVVNLTSKEFIVEFNQVEQEIQTFVGLNFASNSTFGKIDIIGNKAKCSNNFFSLLAGLTISTVNVIRNIVTAKTFIRFDNAGTTNTITYMMVDANDVDGYYSTPTSTNSNIFILVNKGFTVSTFIIVHNTVSKSNLYHFWSNTTSNTISKMEFSHNTFNMVGTFNNATTYFMFHRVMEGMCSFNTFDFKQLTNESGGASVALNIQKYNNFNVVEASNVYNGTYSITAGGAD